MPRNKTFLSAGDIPVFLSIHVPGAFHLRNFLSIAIYCQKERTETRCITYSNKKRNFKFEGKKNIYRKQKEDKLVKVQTGQTLGTTVHSERLLAVSNVCEAAAATAPAKPAAKLEAKGGTGPASSRFLKNGKRLG